MLSERITRNPHWQPTVGGPIPRARSAAVDAFHRSLPGYAPTALVELPTLAARLGARSVHVKYEAQRMGLPSFKVMGASWAVAGAIAARLGAPVPGDFDHAVNLAAALPASTTLTTATDGNHGRAVAHMARLLGRPSRIFVPSGMAAARIDAIRSEGAEVMVIEGSYDEVVAHSAAQARRHPDHVLVSDTSWPGYESVPATVVEGYGTIFAEAFAQLGATTDTGFDVAFVPVGVGAFASAAVHALGPAGCDVVTVEPADADCLRRSLAAGQRVDVPGPHRSIMAGLNCGEVSIIAWPALLRGVHTATAVTDDETRDAIRALAAAGLPSGESGAAALAGADALARSDPAALAGRTVLLLDTEGVTDPQAYDELIRPN